MEVDDDKSKEVESMRDDIVSFPVSRRDSQNDIQTHGRQRSRSQIHNQEIIEENKEMNSS